MLIQFFVSLRLHLFVYVAKKLSKQLDEWLHDVERKDYQTRAIIAPHAGYKYSGPTAAHAYKNMVPANIKRVVLLGPSHHYSFRECGLSRLDYYATPLGDIALDRDTISKLHASGHYVMLDKSVEEDEHSLEMQLPFIYKVMDGHPFGLVPIMVGHLRSESYMQYAKTLQPLLDDPHTFFVISSDFCHWGVRFNYTYYDPTLGAIHESIKHLDTLGMKAIESGDPSKFLNYLKETQNTICGRNPILLLMHTLQIAKTPLAITFVHYTQSSQCLSLDDSSVSYAAALVYLKPSHVSPSNNNNNNNNQKSNNNESKS
jgi:AmmeMemoRadiSam system protein B